VLKERITSEEKTPKASTIWRASEVGECETFLCHVRMGHESESFSGRVRHMLDDGVTHEHDIVTRLRTSGIKVLHSYVEGQIGVQCASNVTGHPDGILDVTMTMTSSLMLDYADESFKTGQRFYLLEITAPNHFTFLRLKRSHLREILWRKYVQIQMYLNSEEVSSFGNCAIAIVKNKNTSELYEEGISLDNALISDTLEKLKRVEDLVLKGKISEFRCSDWRRGYCRYRHLCYDDAVLPSLLESQDILRGESLNEAEQLKEAAEVWRKGKLLKLEGEDLIAETRELFQEVIGQYGCAGLTIEGVRALMIGVGITRRADYDLLKNKYAKVYDEVVSESPRESYVKVSD